MTKKQEDSLRAKIWQLLASYKVHGAQTKDIAIYLDRLIGPVSVRLTSREGREIVSRAVKDMRNVRAATQRQFQSARYRDASGKMVRGWVQMEIASDEQRRSIVKDNEANALAQIKTTINLWKDATKFGTQMDMPFPEYADGIPDAADY